MSATATIVPGHRDRDRLVTACNEADAQLHAVSCSFDFLLCVTPTNIVEAMEAFLAADGREAPRFVYRDLPIDPAATQRDLQAIDFAHLHEPLVEGLLLEKRRELHLQLDLLCARGTREFRTLGETLYGGVSDALLEQARAILARVPSREEKSPVVDAIEIASRARALVDHYRALDPAFAPTIEIRDDVAGLMVNYPTLRIAASSRVAERRVDPLLAHEISVHLLTGHNGAHQGLSLFSTGLAGYEEIQEGLGVFAEWAVGGLTVPRLRLLAGRVVAVDAMLGGADFGETYRLLHAEYGLGRRRAFQIAARVHRGGGLAKDAIYLRGFERVMEWVADGGSLDPYWRAKIAPVHVPVLDRLADQGLVGPARLTPEFLDRKDTAARIARFRADPTRALDPQPE
ncbi:tyrosine/phenylalanine carboxypeptidase domain-containing protein [Sphingomonas sp. ASV193]|uniref:flavohemoglobin expression-modulating QEGLA motif protein n=1 Tax=Sphingomonas sp. ASV193 TaxID=3144405 RepID=UPI0032E84FFC